MVNVGGSYEKQNESSVDMNAVFYNSAEQREVVQSEDTVILAMDIGVAEKELGDKIRLGAYSRDSSSHGGEPFLIQKMWRGSHDRLEKQFLLDTRTV